MIALSVSGLSKRYDLYDNSRARLKEWAYFGRKKFHREFWALRGVSFDVPKGQSLGIIGRNGAGKSTLLKCLTGITCPTEGSVVVNGSVSSLLELGAGFHPEFTGRDNIYMNAGLLGLERAFVDERINDIIDFSEIREFIDLPVKFYSSGMAVRLGFSVAIHMDPEILIVDEALAVGDIKFQRKCINAMREYKRNGVTIILVTHSLGDVGSFCERVLLIEDGRIAMDGTTERVIEFYRDKMAASDDEPGTARRWNPLKADIRTSEDTGEVKILEVGFYDGMGSRVEKIRTGSPLSVRISYEAVKRIVNPLFRVVFYRNDGLMVLGTNTYRQGVDLGDVYGKGTIELTFDSFNLNEGSYYITVGISPDEYSSFMADKSYDIHDMAYSIQVESGREHGGGLVYCPSRWVNIQDI